MTTPPDRRATITEVDREAAREALVGLAVDHPWRLVAAIAQALADTREAAETKRSPMARAWKAVAARYRRAFMRVSDPRILSMDIADGSLKIGIDGRGIGQVMAHAYWELLTESKADNYVEMRFGRGDRELSVTVQKVAGKTPAQLRSEAEKRAEAAEARASILVRALEWFRDMSHCNSDLFRRASRALAEYAEAGSKKP